LILRRGSKMKKLAMVLTVLFVCQGLAFAGAPAPVMERPVPVEQVTPPPPPPPAPYQEPVRPLIISKYGTWGLGLGGNPMIGVVEKDQYGYPHTEYTGPFYGVNWVFGFGLTTFNGQPTPEQIANAITEIKRADANVADKDIPALVRKKLGNTLTYTHLGTALLVLPINAEIGMQWILSDNCRTRLGIGIPTILCFGINWDF
jgi:hypothetical protein